MNKKKFVRSIEKAFRALPEYLAWSNAVKLQHCCWKDCPVTGDIVKLEAHHYPFTLYEIIEKIVEENPDKSAYEILGIVIKKHLDGEVESITLCPYHHEMFHELVKKHKSPSQYLEEF
jgi:hypothetical protein